MLKFKANVAIIGINPFVFVPEDILTEIFKQAGKSKGAIPVSGMINNKHYQQTLVKYSDFWRLYINTTMLKNSPERIGEIVDVTISFDPSDRTITPHPKLVEALEKNTAAKDIFDSISPYLRKEIVRYISLLKTTQSVDNNVAKAIDFLLGKGKFIGRDHP